MTNEEFNELFRQRTLKFALDIIEFIETIPFNSATRVMTFQLSKAGTSVGANYRAFCRGRSKNERFAKICIVVEEADETEYWLLIFSKTKYGDEKEKARLLGEAIEILKLTSAIKNSITN